MKALLHIHTSFSHDGEVTPEDVVRGARSLGADAVFITEHLEGLGASSYGELVSLAGELSHDSVTVVPGLEIQMPGGGDLLALGVAAIPPSSDIRRTADWVREAGGVAVLAHPEEAGDLEPSFLRRLDGVEVWNGLHDSKYFPNGGALAFLARARAHNGRLFGCCGLDLHRCDGWFPLTLELDAQLADPLEALRAGAFTYGRRKMRFAADWVPGRTALASLCAMTAAYKALSAGLNAAGLSLPRSLCTAMRKSAGEK